jgi:hypothetical protein
MYDTQREYKIEDASMGATPTKQSGVRLQVDRSHEIEEKMGKMVDVLFERLRPVLKGDAEKKSPVDGVERDSNVCDMARALKIHADKMEELY